MENFKIVNETIIEERKAEIVENFVCDVATRAHLQEN